MKQTSSFSRGEWRVRRYKGWRKRENNPWKTASGFSAKINTFLVFSPSPTGLIFFHTHIFAFQYFSSLHLPRLNISSSLEVSLLIRLVRFYPGNHHFSNSYFYHLFPTANFMNTNTRKFLFPLGFSPPPIFQSFFDIFVHAYQPLLEFNFWEMLNFRPFTQRLYELVLQAITNSRRGSTEWNNTFPLIPSIHCFQMNKFA